MAANLFPADRLPASSAFDRQGVRRQRALTEYQRDPEGFFMHVLEIPRETIRWSLNAGYGAHTWDGTRDPLVAVLEALARGEDVGVESATGTGKSYECAGIVLWFLGCWEGARTFTFAPKEDQLRLFMWAEIGRMWPRFARWFPDAELLDLEIRMSPKPEHALWGAHGYAVGVRAGEDSATKAQGMHAEHMLLVYEETPGIPLPVLMAGENTTTGSHNLRLAVGNPDHQQDTLHQFCTSPGVTSIRISAYDHPNVVTGREMIPGAVTVKSLERRVAKYGEGSRMVLSRVRGLSPSEADDALIRAEWVRAAQARYPEARYRVGLPAWGVDVANSEHGDKGAVARWLGACLLEVAAKPCPDANVLGAEVVAEAKATKGGSPRHVGIDSVGVGAGAVNEAKRLGFLAQALNGGAGAKLPTVDEPEDVSGDRKRVVNEERFYNLRAQMWWQMREDLQHGRIALPADDELLRDLISPAFETRNGRILVEAKEEIVRRLGRSPNKGDAAVYGNWVRHRQPLPPPDDDDAPEARRTRAFGHYITRNRPNRTAYLDEQFGEY